MRFGYVPVATLGPMGMPKPAFFAAVYYNTRSLVQEQVLARVNFLSMLLLPLVFPLTAALTNHGAIPSPSTPGPANFVNAEPQRHCTQMSLSVWFVREVRAGQ